MKKGKKKKLIIVGIIVLFIGSITIFGYNMFGHRPKKLSSTQGYESALPSDDVLIRYSFENAAWSYTYYGELILNDGKRYAFNCTGRYGGGCRLKDKRPISQKDINKIIKYESELSDYTDWKNNGADMGETSIGYFKNKEYYILAGKGDSTITNDSSGAKKILRILLKYGIYV